MSVRITVDPQLCMGSGTCLSVAPTLFDMNDHGVAEPRQRVVEPNSRLDDAISRCPTAAIETTPTP